MADAAEDFKEGMRKVWSMGDYEPIARLLVPAARSLVDATAISAGQEVLDVAAGTGNVALLAAEEGADVTACDIAPGMVEIGKARLEAEGVDVEWLLADAENLPFDDASFECVTSVFGAMFAPNPEAVAAELFRVVKPGNTVGLAVWGDYGPNAELFAVGAKYRPPLEGIPDPQLWGREEVVEERFGPHAGTLEMNRKSIPFEFESEDAAWEVFSNNGPQKAMMEAIGPERAAAFKAETQEVLRRVNTRSDGSVHYDADYLEIVARKRG